MRQAERRKRTKSHRPLSTDSAKAAPASTKKKVQSSIRKQQAMAKNATALKQDKATFSSKAISLSRSDTDVNSADDLELSATSISTESKMVEKRKKNLGVLLSQLQQQKELIASLNSSLSKRIHACKPCIAIYVTSYIATERILAT